MTRKLTFKFLSVVVLTLFGARAGAQTTTFSYANPGAFPKDQAITTVSPTFSNGTIDGGVHNNVTIFAGTGASGGTNNANPLSATFQNPDGMVKDALGNYYVAELGGKRIRKISNTGEVSTIKQFSSFEPRDISINSSNGDLYIILSTRLLKIANSNAANYPNQDPVYVWVNDATHVVAGTSNQATQDGTGTAAGFWDLNSVTISPDNTYLILTDGLVDYICPPNPARIRKVLLSNFAVSTIQQCGWKDWAGVTTPSTAEWACGVGIFQSLLQSDFYGTNFIPKDVMIVNNNLMYVLLERRDFLGNDWNGYDRIVSLSFQTTTDLVYTPPQGSNTPTGPPTGYQTYPYKWGSMIAGSSGGMTNNNYDGSSTTVNFDVLQALTKDEAGNLYVLENEKIRKITPSGHVSTIAGSIWTAAGDALGQGVNSRFNAVDLYYDAAGFLLVTDYANHKIKKVQLEGFEIIPSVPTGLSYNAANGQLTGTPTEYSLADYYINAFNASQLTNPTTTTVLGNANGQAVTLSGDAALVGDYLMLTPRANNKFGGLTIPASGINSNAVRVSFNYIMSKTTTEDPADGFSYSFAPDASATATAPVAELGTGSKLTVSFATYSNGSNRGIRVYYNPASNQTFSTTTNPNGPLLAYSNNTSWFGGSAAIDIKVSIDGKLTLLVNGNTIFSNVQLPSDYTSSDKSTWKHVFKARTGGSDDLMAIDNLAIQQGYGVTNHKVIARNAGSSITQTLPIFVTIEALTASSPQTLCAGSTVANLAATTTVSGATIAWYAAATGGTALSSSTVLSSGTYYAAQISGSQESGREPISVTIQSLGSVSGSAAVCSGSTANLTALNTTGNIQWQVSVDGGTSYSNIAGETSSSYTTAALSSAASYRVNYTSGVCSSQNSAALAVGIDQGSVAGTISGASSVCSGSTASLTLTGFTGTIVWTSSAALAGPYTSLGVATANLTTPAVNATTYFRAQVTNGACPAALSAVHTVGLTSLGNISAISGPSSVTPGGAAVTYQVSEVSNATSYVWNMPAGLTITTPSNNGRTVQVAVSNSFVGGVVSVYAQGCTNLESQIMSKTITASGQAGIAITTTQAGAPVICGGTNGVSFSVTSAVGATYFWSLPTGVTLATGSTGTGSSIVVNFASNYVGGLLSCTRTTSTGSLTAYYTVSAITQPGTITQTGAICGGTSSTFSIASVANATSYQWQLPTGMTGSSTGTSITASYTGSVSGSVQVRAVGTCGTSAWTTLGVGGVATPSSITGPTIICGAATYTITGNTMTQVSQTTLNYSVTNVSGMDYTWTVPTGMTITSVGNTNAIVVEVDPTAFTNGQVSVIATSQVNTSCVSSARTLDVYKAVNSITGPSLIPSTITSVTYTVPNVTGYTYSWTAPTGMSITSGATTNSIIVAVTHPLCYSGQVSCVIGTTCGNTTVSKTVSTANNTAVLSSFNNGTQGYYINVTVAPVAGATGYKFKFVNSLGTVYAESSNHVMPLYLVPNFTYGETYDVSVAVKTISTSYDDNGYGCSVTINTPTTTINPSSCGTTIGYYSNILATPMGPNTGYKFKLVEGVNTTYVTSTNHVLPTYTIPGFKYGVTYSVSVAIKNANNEYGGYGPACNISTTAPSISNASCNSTVGYYANILATPMGPNTGYMFKLVEGVNTTYVTSTNHVLPTYTIPNFKYGVTYTVSVAIKNSNNEYGGYSQTCTFNTTAPTISNASCGNTVGYYANILATPMGPNSGYKFKLVNGSTTIEVESTNHVLPVYSIPQIQPNTAYTVSVAIKNSNNEYGGYGTSCTVNTGNFTITTALATSSCGATVDANTNITINPIAGAIAYQVTMTGPGTATTQYVGTVESTNVFTMTQFNASAAPQSTMPYGTYSVKVKFAYNGENFGTAGYGCSLTYQAPEPDPTPLAQQDPQLYQEATEGVVNQEEETLISELNNTWTATATSNPFAHSFKVNLNGAEAIENAAMFTATLTDMSGKVYTMQTLSKDTLAEENFGQDLAPGMYLMTLRQGEVLRVLRVVKR